ncbi:MAG: single-stranded-DNA-specific exonuclease RecJ [Deltaproteobacteria bacterium]|jgi:single-stranded-DNA-specific exonuclease|nr:single-stranded-DNA-specific exonuclease RecJ [Deltaproteobacteria bacterium]
MLWRHRARPRRDEALRLSRELGKPLKFCEFLLARGISDSADAIRFAKADLKGLPLPETMPGMKDAVGLLLRARDNGDVVAIHGDYDADGLTATALLARALGSFGYRTINHVPDRLSEGYGLSEEAVRSIRGRGAGLLVTVDCGVSDMGAVLLANELGLPVLVTDHHRIPPRLPPAQAIINPHLGGGFAESPMAGVGVAFMLAWALQRALKARGVEPSGPPLVESLALVALGTIADLVPLTGINRTLVRNGLRLLSGSAWPCLSALKEAARLADAAHVTVRDVGFGMAPRLNAAGRMGSAQPALGLLLSDDPRSAKGFALELDRLNKDRYDGQARLLSLALDKLAGADSGGRQTVVLAGESWHRGLLGLVASKVAELTRKPTVLLSLENGMAFGSGRAAPGYDLLRALDSARPLCLSLGGHSEAAGLRLRAKDLPAFELAFEEGARRQPKPPPEDELSIDFEAGFQDLKVLFKPLGDLEPFGMGHPAPVALVRGVRVLDAAPAKTNGDKHMVLRVQDGATGIGLVGFNLAHMLPKVSPVLDVAMVYEPWVSNHRVPGWRLADFKDAGDWPAQSSQGAT